MRTKTPWGWVTVNLNSYQGPAVKGRTLMAVVDERDPNENETNRPSISGVLGTYNHLIDSIIRVDSTRQMYYRRLQTLVDDYLMSGRLEALVSSTYDRIKDLAVKDAKLWETGIDPEKGMLQITTEFLPTRLQQMTLLYGPNGSQPILPGPQSASAALSLVVKRDPPYLVLTNPLVEAVDLSGWQLNASASAAKEVQVFAFPPGTVIPAMQDLILAPEGTNTRLETGKFILGPLAADLDDLGSLPVGAFKLLRGPG